MEFFVDIRDEFRHQPNKPVPSTIRHQPSDAQFANDLHRRVLSNQTTCCLRLRHPYSALVATSPGPCVKDAPLRPLCLHRRQHLLMLLHLHLWRWRPVRRQLLHCRHLCTRRSHPLLLLTSSHYSGSAAGSEATTSSATPLASLPSVATNPPFVSRTIQKYSCLLKRIPSCGPHSDKRRQRTRRRYRYSTCLSGSSGSATILTVALHLRATGRQTLWRRQRFCPARARHRVCLASHLQPTELKKTWGPWKVHKQ